MRKIYFSCIALGAALLTACSSDTAGVSDDSIRMPVILAIPVSQQMETRAIGDPGSYEKFVMPKHLYLYLINTNNEGTVDQIITPEGMDATNGYTLDEEKWRKTVISTADFQTTGDSIYRYTDQININLPANRSQGVVYAAMSAEPITVTKSTATSLSDQVRDATFALPSSVADADCGEALKNIYSTPYNLKKTTDASTYYGTVSDYTSNTPHLEIVLYHTAAKLDVNWNVDPSIQSTTNVKSITFTGLSAGGFLFKPMENTTAASRTYSETVTTDPGNQYYGRYETYVLPFAADLDSYTLNMTLTNGVDSKESSPSTTISLGNKQATAIFTPWMLGKIQIKNTW
ncbi:MAG: hypothetical protein PUD15_04960 [Prevotella sp.]|nr:hypothetical protein [Prevotella sp.]